jgi:hypothetical protein
MAAPAFHRTAMMKRTCSDFEENQVSIGRLNRRKHGRPLRREPARLRRLWGALRRAGFRRKDKIGKQNGKRKLDTD